MTSKKITLEVRNIHWFSVEDGERGDLCAHGQVFLKIEDKIVSDENSGNWTVSTAAYQFLKKTLRKNYEGNEKYKLIPHCGHSMFLDDETGEVILLGCPYGVDWKITHQESKIIHSFDDGDSIATSLDEWVKAVCEFSDEVMDFYTKSSEKIPYDKYSREAYEKFMEEWKQLRREAAT